MRKRTRGFTLVESMLVLFVLAMLTMISGSHLKKIRMAADINEVVTDISFVQMAAINSTHSHTYTNRRENVEVTYNRLGNAYRAQTLHVQGCRIIIALGTGRVYVKP